MKNHNIFTHEFLHTDLLIVNVISLNIQQTTNNKQHIIKQLTYYKIITKLQRFRTNTKWLFI